MDIDRLYGICKATPSECGSPCDLCEIEQCIGVDDCEEEFGNNTYFKKMNHDVQSDSDLEQRTASCPQRG